MIKINLLFNLRSVRVILINPEEMEDDKVSWFTARDIKVWKGINYKRLGSVHLRSLPTRKSKN